MFSVAQKRHIAAEVEKLLLSLHHAEMPESKPRFRLHVDGAESWSWADIEPNWVYDDAGKEPGVNPWNERAAHMTKEGLANVVQQAKECHTAGQGE